MYPRTDACPNLWLSSKTKRQESTNWRHRSMILNKTQNKNIIITGLNLHTYATTMINAIIPSTVHSTQHSDNKDNATMNKNCVTFAKQKLGTILQPYDIAAIHDSPPRRDGTRPVICREEGNTHEQARFAKRHVHLLE